MDDPKAANPADAGPARPVDAPPRQAAAVPHVSPSAARRDAILQGGVVIIAVTVTAFVVQWSLDARPAHTSWVVQVLLGVATVGGICWGAWQRYTMWTRPVKLLGEIAERIRKGEMPLDELSKVDGVPGVLVPVLRDLLSDLKTRRAEVQTLEQEMTQRVANRTDALQRMLGTLREKAARDTLTGLYNRRMLDESLPGMVTARLADGRPLTVLMIDVDYFKLLNDTLGHAAGDDLLRSIGQIIRSTARATDLAFRAGGDEFVVVMDATTRESGQALADRLVSLVDALGKTLKVEKKPRLSIGLAELSEVSERTVAALLVAADKALYQVKGNRKRGATPAGRQVVEMR